MRERDVRAEIERRSRAYLDRRHLAVDYYRIRRRLAYPLPLTGLSLPAMEVPGIPDYPWGIWLLWELEERVDCLAWAGSWLDDARAREAARADLAALARWPTYQQYERPDLTTAHAMRILWKGATQWSWLGKEMRLELTEALRRGVQAGIPHLARTFGDSAGNEDRQRRLHNIPLIYALSLAGAAAAGGHSEAARIRETALAGYRAVLDRRAEGHSEGVAYDGYVLDFVASLASLDGGVLAELRHPRFDDVLEESVRLAAPGDAAHVAEIGDVEPRRMSFHLSAQIKLAALEPEPRRSWIARSVRLDWIRADALSALHGLPTAKAGSSAPEAPKEPERPELAVDAHYAICLRSGWGASDLAVAASASSSPMSHLHHDTGSIVIGARGRWLIADPGYQQYMRKREREFTLGGGAHNCPVVGNFAQTGRLRERRYASGIREDGVRWAWIDMTPCYPKEIRLSRVRRYLWLLGAQTVVLADEIEGESGERVDYFWHGDPEAAWWVENGWARVALPEVTLWICSSWARVSQEGLDRLPGSRGHLSLRAGAEKTDRPVFWVFDVEGPRGVRLDGDGFELDVDGTRLEVPRG